MQTNAAKSQLRSVKYRRVRWEEAGLSRTGQGDLLNLNKGK